MTDRTLCDHRSALGPVLLGANTAVAAYLVEEGRLDEALTAAGLAIAFGEPDARSALAHVLDRRGETDAAEEQYRLAMDAGSLPAFRRLGALLHRHGRLEEARAVWIEGHLAGDAACATRWRALGGA